MYSNKKFFILFSQFFLFIFNLVVFIVSICLLNYYGIFSLTGDIVPTFSQKLFVVLFSFSFFSITLFIVPLFIDIYFLIYSYRVKKRDLLINSISSKIYNNLPCYSCSKKNDLKK